MEKLKKKQHQINLTLPDSLLIAAQEYASSYGFKNIQELAIAALREKIFQQNTIPNHEEVKETRHKKHYIM